MIKLTLEYDNKKYSVEIPEPKEDEEYKLTYYCMNLGNGFSGLIDLLLKDKGLK